MTKHSSQLPTAAHTNMQYDPIPFKWIIDLVRGRKYHHWGGTSSQYACETSLGFSGQVAK